MTRKSTCVVLLFLLLFASAICDAQTATCTNWKFFTSGQPNGINRWGTVVGGKSQGSRPTQFGYIRYSDGTFKTYMAPSALDTVFSGRNALGVTVGGYTDNSPMLLSHGLVVSGSHAVTVDYPGATSTGLSGINYWGTIVGNYTTNSGGPYNYTAGAFKLKNGVFSRIIYPGSNANSTYVSSINDKGVIVGTYGDTNGADNHGFVLANGVFKTLDNPKGSSPDVTILIDINGSGAIVGWYYVGPIGHSFLYINGVFKEIAPPNTNYTLVTGINGYGDVTGTTNFNSGGYTSFTAHCQ